MPLPKAPAKPATQLKSDDAVLAKAVLPARSLKKGAPEDDATVPMPMAAAQSTVARESPTRYHATEKAQPTPSAKPARARRHGTGPAKLFVLDKGRLRVGAAVGVLDEERVAALIAKGVDMLVVD
ncbi:MAG: IMP dehydrogenase, partial [Burkholderiaceae bacterium]